MRVERVGSVVSPFAPNRSIDVEVVTTPALAFDDAPFAYLYAPQGRLPMRRDTMIELAHLLLDVALEGMDASSPMSTLRALARALDYDEFARANQERGEEWLVNDEIGPF